MNAWPENADALIRKYAAEGEQIYENRTAGDHTWTGFLATFLMELTGTGTYAPLPDEMENNEYFLVDGTGYVWTYNKEHRAWACTLTPQETRGLESANWALNNGGVFAGMNEGAHDIMSDHGIQS